MTPANATKLYCDECCANWYGWRLNIHGGVGGAHAPQGPGLREEGGHGAHHGQVENLDPRAAIGGKGAGAELEEVRALGGGEHHEERVGDERRGHEQEARGGGLQGGEGAHLGAQRAARCLDDHPGVDEGAGEGVEVAAVPGGRTDGKREQHEADGGVHHASQLEAPRALAVQGVAEERRERGGERGEEGGLGRGGVDLTPHLREDAGAQRRLSMLPLFGVPAPPRFLQGSRSLGKDPTK